MIKLRQKRAQCHQHAMSAEDGSCANTVTTAPDGCVTVAGVIRSEPELAGTSMLLDHYDILPELDDATAAITYVGVNNAGIAVFGAANAQAPKPSDEERHAVCFQPLPHFPCLVVPRNVVCITPSNLCPSSSAAFVVRRKDVPKMWYPISTKNEGTRGGG